MGFADHLSPLHQIGFRRFFLGEVINNAGSSMSSIALAFAVLQINDSATALGWVVASWTVPMVAFMLLGGALADRLPRATVLRGCNLAQGVVQGITAALVLTHSAQVWELAALAFLSGTVFAVSYPAFHGMVPILLPEPERKSAYLLLSQSEGTLRIIGPALAGVLVAVTNAGWVLAVDAATYFAAAYFLALLRLPMGERPERQESVIGDFKAGWTFARALGWLLPGACCSLVYNAVISGGLSVLGPAVANNTIGSAGWGFARAFEAVGIVLFAFILTRVTIRRPMAFIQYGFATIVFPMLVLGLWPHTAALAAALFVFGCGGAMLNLAWNLIVQEKFPEAMLSRMMAIDGFFSFVAMPIGELAIGPFDHAFGARAVAFGCVGLTLATLAYGRSNRAMRAVRLNPASTS